MNSEHQALTEVPLWLLVLLSLAGLSGEMLRASGSDLGLRQILQRVALQKGYVFSLAPACPLIQALRPMTYRS